MSHRKLREALLICLIAPAALAVAQEKPDAGANPLSAHAHFLYGGMENVLLRTAEKMPEENYAFRPAETVRSFGQIIGHLADAQRTFCAIAIGEKSASLQIEKTKTSKADLTAALKDAMAYCDKAYGGMTDASGAQMVNLFGRDMPRLGVLHVNTVHAAEHYGNLVTYMRIKNVVPPTSEPGFQPVPKK
jgi:uncharacterized damage-inducible protein DinB